MTIEATSDAITLSSDLRSLEIPVVVLAQRKTSAQ
jgi:hypothetical protein